MAARLSAWIDGVGLLGPGFDDWGGALPVLDGSSPYVARPLSAPVPASLPPAERRRVGLSVKVALGVAHAALAAADTPAAAVASVFTSSGADGDNCDAICQVLASDDRHISPTRFHNSVHNAPAGYWGIASGAMTPASVLCAYDASFGAGLIEALTLVASDGAGVLLVAYDAPYPEPLNAARPLPAAFGVALALGPGPGERSLARVELELCDAPADTLADPALEALRCAIPAARSLPLLQALAARRPGRVVLDYLAPLGLALTLEPGPRA